MGRTRIWWTVLIVAVAVAAMTSYRIATRPMVVGRAVPDWEPAPPPKIENLVGRHMPRFETVDANGTAVTSDSFRGRPVVVAVWATWCQPCKDELPRIEQEIWRKHRDRLTVIALAGDENAATVNEFNRQAKLTFTLLPDPRRRVTGLFDRDAPIPRIYVVDRDGVIVHQSVGYSEQKFAGVRAAVEAQLAR